MLVFNGLTFISSKLTRQENAPTTGVQPRPAIDAMYQGADIAGKVYKDASPYVFGQNNVFAQNLEDRGKHVPKIHDNAKQHVLVGVGQTIHAYVKQYGLVGVAPAILLSLMGGATACVVGAVRGEIRNLNDADKYLRKGIAWGRAPVDVAGSITSATADMVLKPVAQFTGGFIGFVVGCVMHRASKGEMTPSGSLTLSLYSTGVGTDVVSKSQHLPAAADLPIPEHLAVIFGAKNRSDEPSLSQENYSTAAVYGGSESESAHLTGVNTTAATCGSSDEVSAKEPVEQHTKVPQQIARPKQQKIKPKVEDWNAFIASAKKKGLTVPPELKMASELVCASGKSCWVSSTLSHGAFGKFRVGIRENGDLVALKQVHKGEGKGREEKKTRFTSEANLKAELDVMKAVGAATQPHDSAEIDSKVYLVMPLKSGDLFSILQSGRLLSFAAVESLLAQVAHDLARAHQNGYLHCDIKPENIFFTGEGVMEMGDWGLAERLNKEGTTKKRVGLTPRYASPEALRGKPCTDRSDSFSVGITLLCCLRHDLVPFFKINGDRESQKVARHEMAEWYGRVINTSGIIDWENVYKEINHPWSRCLLGFMEMANKSGPEYTYLVNLIFTSLLNPDPQQRMSMIDLAEKLKPREVSDQVKKEFGEYAFKNEQKQLVLQKVLIEFKSWMESNAIGDEGRAAAP